MMVHLEGLDRDPLDGLDNEMRQIILGHPIAKIRRRKQTLATVMGNKFRDDRF